MKEFGEASQASAMDGYLAMKPEWGNYKDNSMVMCMPTLGMVHWKVWAAWDRVAYPMNQKRVKLYVERAEVGAAYEQMVAQALEDQLTKNWKFILTYEDDNLPDPDAVKKLLNAIYVCPDCEGEIDENTWKCDQGHQGYEGVAGLYFAKTLPPMPLAFGDPKRGPTDMLQRELRDAIRDSKVVEVNGIPNGLTLFRADLFRRVSRPWFLTLNGDGGAMATQDIFFCRKAKHEAGARFAVHCGARVGHIDIKTGVIY